jgi:hypothetical protein
MDLTRRTGVAIDIEKPFHPIFMDARDITPPFTPGHYGAARMHITGALMVSVSALPIMNTLSSNWKK